MTMTGTKGFTLIELLISAAILAVLLAVLGQLFIGTERAYGVNEQLAAEQQQAEVAAQLLQYEIGLAGYRGTGENFDDNIFNNKPTLEITSNAGDSDTITVRYYEDRTFTEDETSLETVTFSTSKDGYGYDTLYRETSGETSKNKQPAIRGVQELEVLGYIRNDGVEVTSLSNAVDLAALRLELSFTNGTTRDIIISLPNTQQNLDPSDLPPLDAETEG